MTAGTLMAWPRKECGGFRVGKETGRGPERFAERRPGQPVRPVRDDVIERGGGLGVTLVVGKADLRKNGTKVAADQIGAVADVVFVDGFGRERPGGVMALAGGKQHGHVFHGVASTIRAGDEQPRGPRALGGEGEVVLSAADRDERLGAVRGERRKFMGELAGRADPGDDDGQGFELGVAGFFGQLVAAGQEGSTRTRPGLEPGLRRISGFDDRDSDQRAVVFLGEVDPAPGIPEEHAVPSVRMEDDAERSIQFPVPGGEPALDRGEREAFAGEGFDLAFVGPLCDGGAERSKNRDEEGDDGGKAGFHGGSMVGRVAGAEGVQIADPFLPAGAAHPEAAFVAECLNMRRCRERAEVLGGAFEVCSLCFDEQGKIDLPGSGREPGDEISGGGAGMEAGREGQGNFRPFPVSGEKQPAWKGAGRSKFFDGFGGFPGGIGGV